MGGRETGGLAHLLPGYRSIAVAEDRAEMRRLWDLPARAPGISPAPGVPATELVEALERGRVQGGLDRRDQPGRLAAGRGALRRRAAAAPSW